MLNWWLNSISGPTNWAHLVQARQVSSMYFRLFFDCCVCCAHPICFFLVSQRRLDASAHQQSFACAQPTCGAISSYAASLQLHRAAYYRPRCQAASVAEAYRRYQQRYFYHAASALSSFWECSHASSVRCDSSSAPIQYRSSGARAIAIGSTKFDDGSIPRLSGRFQCGSTGRTTSCLIRQTWLSSAWHCYDLAPLWLSSTAS